MIVSIDQKKNELQDLERKAQDLTNQIDRLDEEISQQQAMIGDTILNEGKELDKLTRKLNELRFKRSDLQAMLDAVAQKTQRLSMEIREAQRVEAGQRLEVLKGEYEAAVIEVITALDMLYTSSQEMWNCGSEAIHLGRQFELKSPAHYRGIAVGDFDLRQFAHYALMKLEKHMPELYQAAGTLTASERETPLVTRT